MRSTAATEPATIRDHGRVVGFRTGIDFAIVGASPENALWRWTSKSEPLRQSEPGARVVAQNAFERRQVTGGGVAGEVGIEQIVEVAVVHVVAVPRGRRFMRLDAVGEDLAGPGEGERDFHRARAVGCPGDVLDRLPLVVKALDDLSAPPRNPLQAFEQMSHLHLLRFEERPVLEKRLIDELIERPRQPARLIARLLPVVFRDPPPAHLAGPRHEVGDVRAVSCFP